MAETVAITKELREIKPWDDALNQPQVFIYLLPLAPPSHLPPHPTPLGCHRALGVHPLSLSKSLLTICLTYGNIYVSVLVSQIILPSPSPTEFKSLFFMSVSPFLPCM